MFLFIILFSITSIFRPDPIIYGITGSIFEAASLTSHFCGRITQNKECLRISRFFDTVARVSFRQSIKKRHDPYRVWNQNQNELASISAPLASDKKLLCFLQKRYLYKFAGFDPWLVQSVYPCFGLYLQIHPESSNSYERDPSLRLSKKYQKIASSLSDLPLILIKDELVADYFPSYLKIDSSEKSLKLLKDEVEKSHVPVVADLTSKDDLGVQKFFDLCKKEGLHRDVIAIKTIKKDDLRALVLLDDSKEKKLFLLKLISRAGLTTNGIDLDRLEDQPFQPSPEKLTYETISFEDFQTFLKNMKSSENQQKNLMLQGTLSILNGLMTNPYDQSFTKKSICQRSFAKIKSHFEEFSKEESFFESMWHLEKIHAEMSSLIEIFGFFSENDFSNIYKATLTQIPDSVKPLTSCTLHSSAMTSFAAIVKCAETMKGQTPLILFSRQSYYECIEFCNVFARGVCLDGASAEELETADILLTQFHPVLDLGKEANYHLDDVAQSIHRILAHRNKPLVVALDATFDYIDSPATGALLQEFQREILDGKLLFCCFRSGGKFDMLGMDNYWGAPFFMVRSAGFEAFDELLKKPLLMTDRLSLNWFCLAYQNASESLENYRDQIFSNTRALLDQAPILDPMNDIAKPAFVSFRIKGPFHQIRAKLMIAYLCTECLQEGHPIFFRPSIGFYHSNCGIFFEEDFSTIRITVGLDPTQLHVIAKSLAD